MSKRLNEVRQQHAATVKEMRTLHEKAVREDRAFSPAEQSLYDTLSRQADGIKASIEREEQLSAEDLRTAKPIDPGLRGVTEHMRDQDSGDVLPIGRRGTDWRSLFSEQDRELVSAFDAGVFGIDDFVRGVAGQRTTPAAKRALSVGTDSAGGFTVPNVLMPGIFDALVPRSALLEAGTGVVRQEDAGSGGKAFNYAAVNTIPTAAWRNESASVAESDPVFRNIAATPRSLAFFFKVSRELLADSANMRQALNTAIAASFARELDRVGLRGTGTAPQPRGLLNTAGVQLVTNGAAGASLATLRFANLLSGYQAIRSADAPAPTAAIMAPRTLVGFSALADTTNQPMRRPPLLESMRMLDTSQIPVNLTVGASNDCSEVYTGDFRWTLFFMRENVSIQLLTELYAGTGEIGFMCHVRADFLVIYPAAFAVITGVRP